MILELSKSSLKDYFIREFQECRAQTLELLDSLDEETFCCLAHPDFSPVGWHLGHIAYTESLWLLERGASQKPMFPQYRKLYAADGLPKSERVQLPTIEETRYYLDTVREKVLDYLKGVDIEPQERLWRFLLQHESQHCETACIVLKLISSTPFRLAPSLFSLSSEMVKIQKGEFDMGSNSPDALDNERAAHPVYLDTYFIDKYPITSRKYREFMESGGYENAQYWSDVGWRWLQLEEVKQPLYWHDDGAYENHPVVGVSYYEAEAYAKFVGKRLPTEAEWEKAARWDEQANCSRTYPWGEEEPTQEFCNCAASPSNIFQTTPVNAYPKGQSMYGMYDALGNVWEWTNSWFDAYKGFEYYPYIGYSQVYFDNKHKVLKGSSWATRPTCTRASFRNWYYPHVRQIFAGFRCASD